MSTKSCCTCGRGWESANGKIGCGAAVDQESLEKMSVGNNPVWAWRKYGPFALLGVSASKNTDCENMDKSDGAHCAAWIEK